MTETNRGRYDICDGLDDTVLPRTTSQVERELRRRRPNINDKDDAIIDRSLRVKRMKRRLYLLKKKEATPGYYDEEF